MPLDVQPVSRSRRIIRILVMAALLAGSLGLAQVLVLHHRPASTLQVDFPPPPHVDQMPVNESPDALVEALATWPQGRRSFMAFCWEDAHDADPRQYLLSLMTQALPDVPLGAVGMHPAVLAGSPAWEAERHAGTGENAVFAIIRLAPVEDHIVAFCFRGDGGMTDADKEFFDDYCSRQIRVRLDRTP